MPAFDVPLAVATSALTAYLLGSTAGIVAGGIFAAAAERHDRVARAGLLAGALVVLLIARGRPRARRCLPLFALAGFALGCTGPSRDMIVRSATPPGAAGRVYGFVYSGLDLGGMIGPVWFGFLLDHGAGARACFSRSPRASRSRSARCCRCGARWRRRGRRQRRKER